MNVIAIGGVGNGRGYIDKQMFPKTIFSYSSSRKTGNAERTALTKKLDNYPYIMYILSTESPELINLLALSDEGEDTSSIHYYPGNNFIQSCRLSNAPLQGRCTIIYPLETVFTKMGKALYNYSTKGGPIPSVHKYPHNELIDQEMLANIIRDGHHSVILYDNIKCAPVMLIERGHVFGRSDLLDKLVSHRLRDEIERLYD